MCFGVHTDPVAARQAGERDSEIAVDVAHASSAEIRDEAGCFRGRSRLHERRIRLACNDIDTSDDDTLTSHVLVIGNLCRPSEVGALQSPH